MIGQLDFLTLSIVHNCIQYESKRELMRPTTSSQNLGIFGTSPGPPEKWHSMSLEVVFVVEDHTTGVDESMWRETHISSLGWASPSTMDAGWITRYTPSCLTPPGLDSRGVLFWVLLDMVPHLGPGGLGCPYQGNIMPDNWATKNDTHLPPQNKNTNTNTSRKKK